MAFTARDVVPFTQARTLLTVLAHQAKGRRRDDHHKQQ